METFALLAFLINAAMIAAGGVVVIAIWYGTKALVKTANSIARMADSMERIEKILMRDNGPRV
jgi:hypothetical protein